jgi:hypothetical protein
MEPFAHSSEQAAYDRSSNPLNDAIMLGEIFTFVGPGYRLYCALVSKRWLKLYETVQSIEIVLAKAYGSKNSAQVTSSETSGSAVFASVSSLQFALECGLQVSAFSDKMQFAAGQFASIDTIQAAHALGLPWSEQLLHGVALSGDVSKLQYLHKEQKCQLPTYICQQGARSGNLNMIKWLGKTLGCTAFQVGTLCAAASIGHLEMVQYLRSQRCRWTESVSAAAAEAGHLDVLTWLQENGFNWTESVSKSAASAGNLDVLKWLIDNGCPWDDQSLIDGALHSNSIEILQYAQELGAVFGANTMRDAAMNSTLQVGQYLHDNGCPWSADACYSAIYRVDHTVFSWLYNKGCPYDIDGVCRLAIMFGKVDIISILHEQEAISDDDQMTQLLNYAGVLDKLAVAQWLKQHGAQWPLVLW